MNLENLRRIPLQNKRRVFGSENFIQNPWETYTDTEMRSRFRFGRGPIQYLVDLHHDSLSRETKRNHALTPMVQILIALRFLATGHFFEVIGDTFGVCKSTVSRVVHNVVSLLCNMQEEVIVFPTHPEDIQDSMNGFMDIGGFPNVVGCVDGTHIRILRPHQEEYAYVCRKGYHSINTQVVTDHKGEHAKSNLNYQAFNKCSPQRTFRHTCCNSSRWLYWNNLHDNLS